MPRAESAARKLRESADLFAALGDETRLRVVQRLSNEGPLSIAQLTDGAGVTRQAITKHLVVLERARLVKGERVGRESAWALEARRLDEARRAIDRISAQWDVALEKLRTFVEEDG